LARGKTNKSKILSLSSTNLSRRDWVYLLSLLVPFVVYNLALKAANVVSRAGELGLAQTLDLMRSDVFFNLGYVLLWVGLFAAARGGPLRWIMVFLFHAVTMFVVIVNTCAYQYFKDNGTTLDYGTIAEWIPKFEEIIPILTQDVPPAAWALLAAALLYATLGPWFVTCAVGRGWRRPGRRRRRTSPAGTVEPGFPSLSVVGLFLLALGFGSLSLLVEPGSAAGGVGKSFARDPFLNVALTGVQEATAEELDPYAADSANSPTNTRFLTDPPTDASLVPSFETEKRNVVLVHLESTRAQSVTPYNEDLKTTPFLDELAESSLLVERAYTTVPRSSKASVAVNCGIEPPLYPGPEFEPGGVPAQCLPALLKEEGYRTVFFASTFNNMDNFGDVAGGFGYEEIYPAETMDTEGFQRTNTFGLEEDVMLGPSEQWLRERGNQPFMAEYFTGTGHYGYECVPNRYGYEYFSEDEGLDRYHNCLRMLDHFLKNLFEQYKELGLYEDTIFVIFGDHGEGFKEHGRDMHGDTIWEEGLHVPLIIHDPKRFQNGERAEGLSSQIDLLPTVLDLLGYRVQNGEYPGYSLLDPVPEERTLMFSCITNRKCLASIKGYMKYIHHYDDQPDEFFDLSKDPLEKQNLADERATNKIEMDKRREELFAWRSKINALYEGYASSDEANPK
jgi:phosphoglycerol transferase MdoB-like AlkP superfamily enzyme